MVASTANDTLWHGVFTFRDNKVTSATYLLVTNTVKNEQPKFAVAFLSELSLPLLNHGNANSAGYDGC